jgi:hypothetical protein
MALLVINLPLVPPQGFAILVSVLATLDLMVLSPCGEASR